MGSVMPIDSDQETGDLSGPEGPSDREAVAAPSGRFVPVRLDKFLILSVCTFGVYQLVWFYRQWRWVREHEGSRIWPLARTFFMPLWCFALLQRIGFGWATAFLPDAQPTRRTAVGSAPKTSL
jgi:hypothetical protein